MLLTVEKAWRRHSGEGFTGYGGVATVLSIEPSPIHIYIPSA
jgi:hypothetical protein